MGIDVETYDAATGGTRVRSVCLPCHEAHPLPWHWLAANPRVRDSIGACEHPSHCWLGWLEVAYGA